MTYRSSLSFVMLHQFFREIMGLGLRKFFLNACRYSADVWHASQSDQVGVSMHFRLSKFHQWNSFADFVLYPCEYCADFWHVSQSPAFLKAMHTKTETFLIS